MIPLFYGAALLDRLGRSGDGPTVETVAGSRPMRELSESRTERAMRLAPASMMDFVDQARRAATQADPLLLRDLEDTVRRGLADVAGVPAVRALEIVGV